MLLCLLPHSWPLCLSFPGWRGNLVCPPQETFRVFCPFTVSVSRELPAEGQQVQTQLHRSCSEDFYTYHNVPWKIYIRKEVKGLGGVLGTGWCGDKGGFLPSPRPCRLAPHGSPSCQVFYPKDSINNPLVLDLIFRQVRCTSGPEVTQGGPLGAGVSPHLGWGWAVHIAPLTWPRRSSPPSPDLQRHTLQHLPPDQPGGAAPLEIPLR